MRHFTPTIKLSIYAVLCLCVSVMLPAQTASMPKQLGHLDAKDALVFEGNESYTKDQICEALYRDKDVVVSTSPAAPLADYMKTLESKIRLGYLNEGFCSPTVQAAYVAEPEQIVITIEEGPRYTKGDLVIEGASEALKKELLDCVSDADPRVSEASGMKEVMKSIQKGDLSSALTKDVYIALMWYSNAPVSFAPSFINTSAQYLQRLLEALGYYHSEFTLKLVPNHDARTVDLHIRFQKEGEPAAIGTIDIVGNKINSDQQILDYLELKTGQPLDGVLTQSLQIKLVNSGRFRQVSVTHEINSETAVESTLHILVEELDRATALGGTLTEKEQLTRKVGQFMNRYQSWQQDVRIRFDLEKAAQNLSESKIQTFKAKTGISIPDIEIIYSPREGLIFIEKTSDTGILNAFIFTPEQLRYICPLLKRNVFFEGSSIGLVGMFSIGPTKPSSSDDKEWSIAMEAALGNPQDGEGFSTRIDIHPAFWFNMAHDTNNKITFVDKTRAEIMLGNAVMKVDRNSGEIFEIRSEGFNVTFEKGLFNSNLEQMEKCGDETLSSPSRCSSSIAVLSSSILPLYLTHSAKNTMSSEQKILAAQTWQQSLDGFARCRKDSDDGSDHLDSFSLPVDEQLASGGMMPMLMGYLYQSCHDNLPRDSWVRTLSHAVFLMTSGYAQHPSVGQDLQQIYASDQIGPIGYLITAKFLGQLGYPAYNAFAQRGLQVLDADHFRKDWQPLLVKDSELKTELLCYLEQFQAGNNEGIQLVASFLPEKYATLITAVSEKLRSIQTEQPHESLDPILTSFWEKSGKEQIRQQLTNLIVPPKKSVFEQTKIQEAPDHLAEKNTNAASPESGGTGQFNGNFEGGTYTHALGMPMPLGWDGGGGSYRYEKDGSNGYILLSNPAGTWAVAHTQKPPVPLAQLGLTAGEGVLFGADVIGLEGKPHAHLKFEQYKDGGKTANGTTEHHFIPTGNWKRYSETFEIKPDTDSAVFAIVGLGEGASHGIDNVTIAPADNFSDNKITIRLDSDSKGENEPNMPFRQD